MTLFGSALPLEPGTWQEQQYAPFSSVRTAEDRMGFWGTYLVGRYVQVHHGPDGWDSRDLPGAWETTLRALKTGHPVLAAAVLNSDGWQLIGYGPETGRWGGWLMLDPIFGHFHPEAWPQVTLRGTTMRMAFRRPWSTRMRSPSGSATRRPWPG